MERVLAEKSKGPETMAEVTCPVPLPVRRPPRVVDPVPPKLVAMVEEATTAPTALPKWKALVMEVTAKEVEVALVVVPFVAVKLSMTEGAEMVEEA
jgi:hypothetical protein